MTFFMSVLLYVRECACETASDCPTVRLSVWLTTCLCPAASCPFAVDLMVQARMLASQLSGMRVVNIYDVGTCGKMILLKVQGRSTNSTSPEMAASYLDDEEHSSSFTALVLIESGCRIHTTSYARPSPAAPSNFVVLCPAPASFAALPRPVLDASVRKLVLYSRRAHDVVLALPP